MKLLLLTVAALLGVSRAEDDFEEDEFTPNRVCDASNKEDDLCHEGGFSKFEADRLVRKLWRLMWDGEEKFSSMIAPDIKYVVNGEDTGMPWGNPAFAKDIFSKVRFGLPSMVGEVTLTGPRSALVTYAQQLEMRHTGEKIEFSRWSMALQWNEQRKLTHAISVVPGEQWEMVTGALQDQLPFQSYLDKFVSAISNSDKTKVKECFHEQFKMTRNQQTDDTPWTDDDFLNMLFSKTRWTAKLLEWKQTTTRNVVAIFSFDVEILGGPSSGQKFQWLDSWNIYFTSEGKMVFISSIMDSAPFTALDEALSA